MAPHGGRRPIPDRMFDDFAVGERIETRGVTLTESMIVDFALTYDPQSFHLDAQAASASIFGGLIASGFQTLALSFRMVLETGILRAASLGSPGMDELRWLRPVRPGDTLRTEMEVTDVKPSRSKPDRGVVSARYTVRNQRGEPVMTYRGMHLLRRRDGVNTAIDAGTVST